MIDLPSIFLERDNKSMQKTIKKERMGHMKVPKYLKNDEHKKAHKKIS
jgi:hypothetical protein